MPYILVLQDEFFTTHALLHIAIISREKSLWFLTYPRIFYLRNLTKEAVPRNAAAPSTKFSPQNVWTCKTMDFFSLEITATHLFPNEGERKAYPLHSYITFIFHLLEVAWTEFLCYNNCEKYTYKFVQICLLGCILCMWCVKIANSDLRQLYKWKWAMSRMPYFVQVLRLLELLILQNGDATVWEQQLIENGFYSEPTGRQDSLYAAQLNELHNIQTAVCRGYYSRRAMLQLQSDICAREYCVVICSDPLTHPQP